MFIFCLYEKQKLRINLFILCCVWYETEDNKKNQQPVSRSIIKHRQNLGSILDFIVLTISISSSIKRVCQSICTADAFIFFLWAYTARLVPWCTVVPGWIGTGRARRIAAHGVVTAPAGCQPADKWTSGVRSVYADSRHEYLIADCVTVNWLLTLCVFYRLRFLHRTYTRVHA